jgi:hypothetical protein
VKQSSVFIFEKSLSFIAQASKPLQFKAVNVELSKLTMN